MAVTKTITVYSRYAILHATTMETCPGYYYSQITTQSHVKGLLWRNRRLLSLIFRLFPQRCARVPPSSRSMTKKRSGWLPAPTKRTMLGWRSRIRRSISRSSSCRGTATHRDCDVIIQRFIRNGTYSFYKFDFKVYIEFSI